jgi:hypothetical protein
LSNIEQGFAQVPLSWRVFRGKTRDEEVGLGRAMGV